MAVLGLLAAALLVPTSTVAFADPTTTTTTSQSLQVRAQALRSQVEDLRLRQSIATEDYDTSASEVTQAISAEVAAQASLNSARGTSRSTRTDATRRVRSLYIDGAGAQLRGRLNTVLAVGDLDDLTRAVEAAHVARSVVTDDTSTLTAADDAARTASEAETRLVQVREQKTTAQAAAAEARTQVTQALAEQQALLAAADTAVVQAVAREEEEARQAALATAAAAAARAGVADRAAGGALAVTGSADGVSVADAIAGASSTAQAAIAAAGTRRGLDYVWGATGPTTFDCSGLTQWAYAQAGVSIPRTSRQQFAGLPKVSLDALQPGDLVFYASGSDPSSIHHVALYLGGGKVLHAPHTGDVVREAGVVMPGLYGAVRPGAGA
ncbi:MAG: C40 family peptidase [Janthinobacterium lividum]